MFYKEIQNLIGPITHWLDPYFTRNEFITMQKAQEITFDIFEILLNFSIFLILFCKFPKYWKPLIGWDTALLKLKICVLQRDSEPNTAPNTLIWHSFDPIWPHIDRGSSGDHFWHFWNFAQFLCFSDFFGNSPNIETSYWLRYSTCKVEDSRFTKEFRT